MHVIATKVLPSRCRTDLFRYCPTMDLIAVIQVANPAGSGESVDVYRLNGQRVFGWGGEEGVKVCGLEWKSDGTMLAIASSDRIIRLIDSFSSKIAHQLSLDSTSVNQFSSAPSSQASRQSSSLPSSQSASDYTPTTILWTSHFEDPTTTRSQLYSRSNIVLDDLLALHADIPSLLRVSSDLPAELTGLDIEASLPKLSTLPATGADDDVFSTRTSIDAIFHNANNLTGISSTTSAKRNVIDALLVGHTDGSVHMRIFDTFEIGRINVAAALPKDLGQRPPSVVKIGGHPFLSTSLVVVQADSHMHLLAINLRFIPAIAHILPTLATKATRLQNILRYMNQICMQLTAELKTAFDLPGRFLRNVNESLAEQDPDSNFATAIALLVVTGECNPRLKEWLVDEVGERGLKRWEKAVSDCLELVRRLTSECLLPAIERSLVVLSRLDGLSKYGAVASRLGLQEKRVKEVTDTVNVLGIIAEELLKDVCIELKEFAAFMRFLKFEAEVLAIEASSERAEEMREAQEHNEIRTVLEYVGGALQESRMKQYFGAAQSSHDETFGDEGQFYEAFKAARKAGKKGWVTPKLDEVLRRMQVQANRVFTQIAESLRKSITVSYLVDLEDQDEVHLRFVPADDGEPCFNAFVAATSEKRPHAIRLNTLQAHFDGTVIYKGGLDISIQGIRDIGFADDSSFLALADTGKDIKVMTYALFQEDNSNDEAKWTESHVFVNGNMENGSKAGRLVINGRKGRRSATIMDDEGKSYVVLDLDSAERAEEEHEL